MPTKRTTKRFDQKAIRNWTLYVVRLKNGHYYIGITSRKDFMRRINQHGGRLGARVNRGNEAQEIIEVHDLGKMTALRAEHIENDIMLQYRKKFGAQKVRGGYDISKKTPIIPTYTPGSTQSFIFILTCLFLAVMLLAMIILSGQPTGS